MARVLGLDHGRRRIGVAVADTKTGVATGLDTIRFEGWKDLRAMLGTVIAEQEVERFVVGYPLALDGGRTERCAQVETFSRRLVGWFGLPVTLWDERLTSAQASRVQQEAGRSERQARAAGMLDRASATLLLQNWLDHPDKAGVPWDPHAGPGNQGEESAKA
jgi:putative Holliday junction resolvase